MTEERFKVIETPLKGLKVIKRMPIEDPRGFFCRFFCAEDFARLGFDKPVVQMNQVFTRRPGTVRGLHFQYPPAAEAKLVSCIRGEVCDVAVDLRQGSPTFMKWHAEIISEKNMTSLLIPEGFAQGYQTLTGDCEMLYLHSAAYCPEAVGAFNVLDPGLGIKWPLEISEISERDRQHPFIGDDFKGVRI